MPHKKLTLVVHGIGEQESGETLAQLVGGVAGDRPYRVSTDTRMFRDEHPKTDPRAIDLYPCRIDRVRTNGNEVVFAEVFWADISRSAPGYLWTLYELVKTILSLGYIVRENAAEKHPIATAGAKAGKKHPLRWAAEAFTYVLHGPILATNTLPAFAFMCLYFLIWALPKINLPYDFTIDSYAKLSVILTIAAGLLVWWVLKPRTHGFLFSIFVDWVKWTSLIFLVILSIYFLKEQGQKIPLIGPFLNTFKPILCAGTNSCAFYWFSTVLLMMQAFSWAVAIALVTFMVFGQLIIDYRKGDSIFRSLYPATATVIVILFMSVAVILWIAMLFFMESVLVGGGFFEIQREYVIYMITYFSLPAWICLGLLICGSVVAFGMRLKQITKVQKTLEQETNTKSIQDILMNVKIQRLIVNPVIYKILILAAIIYVVFNLLPMQDLQEITNEVTIGAVGAMDLLAAKIAITLTSFAIFAYSFGWRLISVGLGVAKDISGYFSSEYPPGQVGAPVPALRNRINNRFRVVANSMIEAEKPDELVIISHSQGTVIAVETLRDGLLDDIMKHLNKNNVSLVTMGSPIEHVYKHYFPNRFKTIDQLKDKIFAWTNIYRIDDFVGTTIGDKQGKWPVNRPVGPNGHTGYWSDDQVRAILEENALGELKRT